MRLVRFEAGGRVAFGVLRSDEIVELAGDFFGPLTMLTTRHPRFAVRLLAPCVPGKIVAVGLNYRDHAAELGLAVPAEPVIFLKPSTAVVGPGGNIRFPPMSAQVDYEAELGVVIKDRVKD